MTITIFGGGGGGGDSPDSASITGVVGSGDAVAVGSLTLADGETVNVSEATLALVDGQPAPTDLDLVIATLDGAGGSTLQTTIISGDGSTVYIDESGDPLGSHQNNSGGEQNVGIYVDNGNFGSGTGSNQDMMADAEFTIE